MESLTTFDPTTIERLLTESNQLLLHIYACQLFVVGVVGASVVCFLLYKFLRKFI